MLSSFKKDKLQVNVYKTRTEMGDAAAADIAACFKALLEKKESINVIFAAAPSQNDVLASLVADKSIEWNRIHAYHMDEYVGLSADAPQGFANFLRRAIFDKVPFASVNTIDCTADPDEEALRYAALLREHPTDVVVMGIGENGHIAFNDPHEALFFDPVLVKKVSLDDVCRMQQVHDGCFKTIDDVPKYALTLTIPALASPAYQFCIVPAPTKAWAVNRTVNGEIGEECPATVLRKLDNAILYCDADSAAELLK